MNPPIKPDASAIDSRADRHARYYRLAGEIAALLYIAVIAEVAYATGAFYIMFPELGALSHDVFTRPRGAWANAPLMLALTPALTGAAGTLVTRALPYSYLSVALAVLAAVAVLLALNSPIAPAISPCSRSCWA